MSELTRRRFVRDSAGAAAGLTALGALGVARADARETAEHPGTEPIVAHVKDPSSGEIAVLHGEHETIIHDRGLAARIARAAR
jgi:hypothetical protein